MRSFFARFQFAICAHVSNLRVQSYKKIISAPKNCHYFDAEIIANQDQMNEIEKVVREELGKLTKTDVINMSTDENISEYTSLDSLSFLELFGKIEEEFKILVPPEKISEIQTIADIVKVVEESKK